MFQLLPERTQDDINVAEYHGYLKCDLELEIKRTLKFMARKFMGVRVVRINNLVKKIFTIISYDKSLHLPIIKERKKGDCLIMGNTIMLDFVGKGILKYVPPGQILISIFVKILRFSCSCCTSRKLIEK